MRTVVVSLFLICVALVACTKRTPAVCCVTEAECEAAGFDGPAPCSGSNVCVENTCQATGCDGDEDCAAPLTCNANQCVQPPDWVARHGGAGDDQAYGVAAMSNGDLVMTGGFQGTVSLAKEPIIAAGIASPWVARYKADGSPRWSVALGDAGLGLGAAVAVDGHDDVYAAGTFVGSADYGSGTSTFSGGSYLTKLSGVDGSRRWARVIGPSNLVTAIVVLDASHVAICGVFSEPSDFGGVTIAPDAPGSSNIFVAIYSATDGSYIWAKSFGTSSQPDEMCTLAVVENDLIISSDFQGTVKLGGPPLVATGSADIFIARLRGSDGSHVWSARYGGSGTTVPKATAAAGDYIFVGGEFTGGTNLGGASFKAAGTQDAFVASYRADDGSPVWSQSFGGADAKCATTSLAATDSKLALAIKFASAPIVIDSQTLAVHDGDIAVVRFSPSTGQPSATPSHVTMSTSTPADSVLSMFLVYTFDHLAGAGSFGGGAKLFGTTLFSAGANDVASFRVDF